MAKKASKKVPAVELRHRQLLEELRAMREDDYRSTRQIADSIHESKKLIRALVPLLEAQARCLSRLERQTR